MKSTLRSAIAACLAAVLAPAAPAWAALSCTASVGGVAFGSLTVRDGSADQTTGTVEYSCSGGTAHARVVACLALGAGSGGAQPDNSPRYMRRADNTPLSYELKSIAQNGPTWGKVVTGMTLDNNGAASFQETIHAEITPIANSEVKGGGYSSTFNGFDATFTFGEGTGEDACQLPGESPTFNVTATITPSCTLDVAPLSFGSVENLENAIDAQTTITANCTNAASYAITLGLGNGQGVTAAARKMTQGSDTITYGLYRNSSRTDAWGDEVSNDLDGTGSGSVQSINIYGRIPSQPTPPPGTYTDTVVVTIIY